MVTKNKNKQPLVPKLRFPEFRNEWKLVPLRDHAIVIKERAGKKKYPVMSIETGVGLVSQLEKFGRDISGNSYKNYTVIQKDDFAYNKSATKPFPEGFIAKHDQDQKAAVPNSIFTCFRLTSGAIESGYLYFQLLNNLHGKWLRKFITVGARANGALSVNTDDLLNLPVPVPTGESSIKEQQKIADCLGSLDDLIAAHSRKLAALQDHKKGLLQQLFPAEGETTPKLRFPGFEGIGEWKEADLGSLCAITTGRLDANAMVDGGKYRFYTCAKDYYFIDDYAFDTDALLVSGNGANVGYVHHYNGKFNAYQRTYVLDGFSENITFIRYFLDRHLARRIELEKMDGNTPYIVRATLAEMAVLVPEPAEQQKIADCLSDLDALITAQTEQIAALKEHKKGLMQQLSPNPELSKA